MITIDLTPEEAKFMFENIAQLQVPMSNPNGALIHQLGHAVLLKLKAGIDATSNVKPLASAARPKKDAPVEELSEAAAA